MSIQNLQAELAEAILDLDQNTDLIAPNKNLSIYKNNIHATLIQTLKSIYPLIVKLVGSDFFLVAAKEYIKQYPSRSGNLHDYGEYFSDFVTHYDPVKNLIYLSEVAEFEWICHQLFFAADHASFDINELEKLSPEEYDHIRFILHPASQLKKFHFPILRIIELCQGEIDDTIDIGEGSVNLLIIRRKLEISLVTLTNAEFSFLTAVQDGLSLAEALEITLKIDADFKLDEKLPGWIEDKTIVDIGDK